MGYKNIAITGKNVASGSTTLAKLLEEKLKWKRHTAGEIFRNYCKEKNWPIEKYKDVPDSVDIEVDERAKEILEKNEKVIYEGWLAGWLAKDFKHTFKILCVAPLDTRIKRFAQRENLSLKEAKEKLVFRDKTTVAKHKRLYKMKNQFDRKYFDLVLETDKMKPEEELKKVLDIIG